MRTLEINEKQRVAIRLGRGNEEIDGESSVVAPPVAEDSAYE